MEDTRFLKGTRYNIDAHTDELWIGANSKRVKCIATVLATPDTRAKKVFVKLDEVDGEHDFECRINKRFLYDEIRERKW